MTTQSKRLKVRWRNIRLPYKLLLVYMPLILLPTLAGLFYLTDSYTSSSKARTAEYATDLLNLMGQKIDERLLNYEKLSRQIMTDKDLLQIISVEPVTTYEKYQIQNELNAKLNSIWLGADQNLYIRSIIIETFKDVYTYGKNAIDNYGASDPDFKSQIANMKGGALWFVPASFADGNTDIHAFRLGRSIRDPKLNVLGTLTIVIESRAITDLFAQTSLQEAAALKLLTADGHILLDNAVELSSDERQLLTYSQDQIHNGWRLSAQLSLKQLYEPIYRTVRVASFLITGCIVLGLVVTQLLAMDLVIPIRKLMLNMKQGIRGVKPGRLKRFSGAIEIVEMNDTFISVMYEIEQLINAIGKQEQKKKEAEIRVLQNQLSPHFLYNTLNSIRWMAMIQKQDNIKEMVDSLNQLLTYALRGKEFDVPLGTELAMLDNYVNIQRVRYQHFDFKKEIPLKLAGARIPKFLLQPIIENALIHGLSHADRPGEITVAAKEEGAVLVLTVQDNGIGMEPNKRMEIVSSLSSGDNHFGFHSVHERIQLHYGTQYGIQLTSEPEQGTRVTLRVPLNMKDPDKESDSHA
jgi:two-component system sensor histidine kinase YesM